MRILVVNVNTTQAMTDSIVASARATAAAGTEIVGLTPTFGAESCEGNVESYLAALGVLDCVLKYPKPFDAVIQAGFGEHGREALQEALNVPVVDITEAAALTAGLLGHKFGVVTTLDRTVPLIEDRLLLAGLDRRCSAVIATGLSVLELEQDHARTIATIIEKAQHIVRAHGVEVICLGCGGMAGLNEAVAQATGAPVVDGVASAVMLAEGLIRMKLSTSKIRTYAPARSKQLRGWPLSS
ncbi:aspartate/glutamate racemase family protein [Castellaniella sp.]|uniref:aspartate/glutamate racemase family protein n=1 Tax=Castellaniella sp. TaxID=1955812 RepID=UPI003A8F9A87